MMRQTPARPARTQIARKELISELVLLTGGPFCRLRCCLPPSQKADFPYHCHIALTYLVHSPNVPTVCRFVKQTARTRCCQHNQHAINASHRCVHFLDSSLFLPSFFPSPPSSSGRRRIDVFSFVFFPLQHAQFGKLVHLEVARKIKTRRKKTFEKE